MTRTNWFAAVCLATAAALPPAVVSGQVFRADLQPLNPSLDAAAPVPSGQAILTLNSDGIAPDGMSGTATLRVQINATGLEDLTGISGATHVAHIHGQFAANEGLPAGQQTNGPFFEGEGGVAVQSVLPSVAGDDEDGDGFLNFFEGLPDYGPVVLNLSAIQVPHAPSGTSPLIQGINIVQADNGIGLLDAFPNNGTDFTLDQTYSFDLSNQDARRQFNNLMPLTSREIVLHGLTVPASISDPIDQAAMDLGLPAVLLGVDAGNGMEFRTTAPVAAGVITVIPEPSSIALLLLASAGSMLVYLRRCR